MGPAATLFRRASIVAKFSLSLSSLSPSVCLSVSSVFLSGTLSTSVFRLQDTCHLPQSPLVVTHTQQSGGETAGVTVRLREAPHSYVLSLITVVAVGLAQKQGPAGLPFLLTLRKTVQTISGNRMHVRRAWEPLGKAKLIPFNASTTVFARGGANLLCGEQGPHLAGGDPCAPSNTPSPP